MMTLHQLAARPGLLPAQATWYIAELAEARGRQELYIRQSPQKLKVLREHALIESATSSNRIEGVEVERSRIGTLMFGKPSLRDRNEEEVHGYRNTLQMIHEQGAQLPVTEDLIKKMHKLCRGDVWDAGRYKEKDVDIVQTYADGRSRVRFKTVPAKKTPEAMAEMVELWQRGLREEWVHPFILAAAVNLDFLCIHPFRDGNGRVSRLLFLLLSYHCGLEAGRYISLERLIEQNKERYYEVLEMSSINWHQGKQDAWPAIHFMLYMLVLACREFEQRMGSLKAPRGEKTALIEAAIDRKTGTFCVADLRAECPSVGVDLIRRVLSKLQREKRIKSLGTGRGARWERMGN